MIEIVKNEISIVGSVWYYPNTGKAHFLTRHTFSKYRAEIIEAYSSRSFELLDKVQGLPLLKPASDNATVILGFSWKADPNQGVLLPPPRQRSLLRGIMGFGFLLIVSLWVFPHFFTSSAYYSGYLFFLFTASKVLFPKIRYRLRNKIQFDQFCSLTKTGLLIGMGFYYYSQISSFNVIEGSTVDIFSIDITPYLIPKWLTLYEPVYVAVPKEISEEFEILLTNQL